MSNDEMIKNHINELFEEEGLELKADCTEQYKVFLVTDGEKIERFKLVARGKKGLKESDGMVGFILWYGSDEQLIKECRKVFKN